MNQAALAFFYRQLAIMFRSGVQLHDALRFASASEDRNLGAIGLFLAELLASGHSLSGAMKTFPLVFGPITIGLIAAAEQSGRLALILDRIADSEMSRHELKRSLQSALTYPVLLLVSTLALSLVLVLYILPMNQDLIASLQVDQPLYQRLFGAAIQAFNSPLFPVLLLTVGGGVVAKLRAPEFRTVARQRLLALVSLFPPVGRLVAQARSYRFLEILALILESGGTFGLALKTMMKATANSTERGQLLALREQIFNGTDFREALSHAELFPPLIVSLLDVGHETGRLGPMARHGARICQEDVRLAIETASSVVEPILMAGVGTMTGFVIVSSALPMLSVLSSL